jgi:hypothetical protein
MSAERMVQAERVRAKSHYGRFYRNVGDRPVPIAQEVTVTVPAAQRGGPALGNRGSLTGAS